MMRFDREQLETLVAVVADGTFDAAAGRLRLTPSAVSQRIKALEQQLGRVVVVRSKPIRPTGSGQALLRLAQQLAMLEQEASSELGVGGVGAGGPSTVVPLAVNADSIATWLLPALAEVAGGGEAQHPLAFELHRDDQEYTAAMLADGTVMAAITSDAHPVAGCTVTPLGRMLYRPVASPAFAARWFPRGVDAAALARAPFIDFDRKDELQQRYRRMVTRSRTPAPRNVVPGSSEFADAVTLGLGWGMLPDLQADALRRDGRLVTLDPVRTISVPLFWQQWNLRSAVLDRVAAVVLAHARAELT